MLVRLIKLFRETPLEDFPKKHPVFVLGVVLLIAGAIISFVNAFLGACILLVSGILVIGATYYEDQ